MARALEELLATSCCDVEVLGPTTCAAAIVWEANKGILAC